MAALYLAAVLLVGVGVAHSWLGERYVLRRIERSGGLPKLTLGGVEMMSQILRFAWHITSIAWFGVAAILVLMAHDALTRGNVGAAIGATFLVSALMSGIPSRGKHYSWLVFLAVAVLVLRETTFAEG